MQSAGRRRFDSRHSARHGSVAGLTKPGQPAGHSEFIEFRGDGRGDLDRRARGSIAETQNGEGLNIDTAPRA